MDVLSQKKKKSCMDVVQAKQYYITTHLNTSNLYIYIYIYIYIIGIAI